MNISEWITGRAARVPKQTAIYFQGGEISYADFERRILAIAAVLMSLGVKKTDRVAILEYNTPDYLALIFACAR